MKPYKKIYHVWTWENDNINFFTEDWKKALKYYQELKQDGYKERRLTADYYWTEEDYENDWNVEEDYIYASDVV